MIQENLVHILNGDALKSTFPKDIAGEIIVARECLVDGRVDASGLQELYETRAHYLSQTYGGTIEDYYQKVVSEFDKVKNISNDEEVCLWFEDDLFCQVNFWFVLYLLKQQGKEREIFYVRPTSELKYGFGGMNESDLQVAFEKRIKIEVSEFDQLSQLWELYQQNNFTGLMLLANKMANKFPFLLPAIEAHIDRFPKEDKPGRPEQSIMNICAQLKTDDFPTVFKAFSTSDSIYGFGDLQVKRIFDQVIKDAS